MHRSAKRQPTRRLPLSWGETAIAFKRFEAITESSYRRSMSSRCPNCKLWSALSSLSFCQVTSPKSHGSSAVLGHRLSSPRHFCGCAPYCQPLALCCDATGGRWGAAQKMADDRRDDSTARFVGYSLSLPLATPPPSTPPSPPPSCQRAERHPRLPPLDQRLRKWPLHGLRGRR